MILCVTVKHPDTGQEAEVRVFVPKGLSEPIHLMDVWSVLKPYVMNNWFVILGYDPTKEGLETITVSQLSGYLKSNLTPV